MLRFRVLAEDSFITDPLFFVYVGKSRRPAVVVCVAVWLYTSKACKARPQPTWAKAKCSRQLLIIIQTALLTLMPVARTIVCLLLDL